MKLPATNHQLQTNLIADVKKNHLDFQGSARVIEEAASPWSNVVQLFCRADQQHINVQV